MGSNDLGVALQQMISEAIAGDPNEFNLELSRARFSSLGAALDGATASLMTRGYHLSGVRASGEEWVATYRRVALTD